MKQLKITSIILGLLLIGFASGFFTHRYLVGQQLERAKVFGRGGPQFGQHMLDKIEASPEQRDQLAPILQEFGQKMKTQSRENRMQHKMIMDSMHQAIKPYLDEKQVETLQELSRRFKERRRKGPPPGREGPPPRRPRDE